MKRIKKIFAKLICFVEIFFILSSGIASNYLVPSMTFVVEAEATELIGAWTLEQFLSAILSLAVAAGIIDKTDIDKEALNSYLENSIKKNTRTIGMERLRELVESIYNNNKSILQKKGYTSSEDLLEDFVSSNVDTYGKYISFIGNLFNQCIGVKVSVPKEVWEDIFEAIKQFVIQNSKKVISIGDDGGLYVGQSSDDIGYSGFNAHAGKLPTVNYVDGAFDIAETISVKSYSKDISKMFLIRYEGDYSYLGDLVFISTEPNQYINIETTRVVNGTTSISTIKQGAGLYKDYYYGTYRVTFDLSNSLKIYCRNLVYNPYDYTIYDGFVASMTDSTKNIGDYIYNHRELFSLEDEKELIFKPKTDDELRDLEGRIINPGIDIPIEDDPTIVDPAKPIVEDPAVPETINPSFIGNWFGKIIAWLESIWDMISNSNTWLGKIADSVSNTYTIQGSILRAVKALDLEHLKNALEEIKVAVLDIPQTLLDIKNDVIGLPDVLEKGWQGIKDVLEDIKDYLSRVVIDINNIPDILEKIRDICIDIPDVLVNIKDKVIAIPDILVNVKEAVLDIPIAIDAVIDWWKSLDWDFPITLKNIWIKLKDFELPKIIDYTKWLDRILAILEQMVQFFVIDNSMILTAAQSISDVASAKFNILGALPNYFDQFKFSNTYDYPKISMGVPNVLVKFIGKEIILIDFGRYKNYLLTIRTCLKGFFWFLFGHHLMKLLTPKFKIG